MITQFQGPYRFLSNFWPCYVAYDGLYYGSAETAYQAQKFPPNQRAKFTLMHPGEAKRAGKLAPHDPTWNGRQRRVMLDVVRAKFTQNKDLRNKLLLTYPLRLEEGNTWGDTYWGVCHGHGENHLGKILMQIREEMR